MGFFKSLFGGSNTPETEKEKNDKKNFEILKYDGIRARHMGKLPYAIKCFEEAVAINDEMETLTLLANAYIQANRLDDARITFNRMADNIQMNDNSRGQFMGNIAHELRTPMTTIKGFIDGMLDGTIPPEETKHYLGIVSQETGRLARLVQNMLDITKLEAGEVPIHAQTYDLWKTVTDVVLSDEQRIEDGKIDIQGLGGDPLPIYADPDFVHQVVYNIVDNAIKFTPAGGAISFAAEKHGSMVEVRIENTGAGIAPEALPFVFERFYKEDRSRGMNTRGSGLGLHICKILINLSGGQIHAESEEGNWCRFVFTLPVGQ